MFLAMFETRFPKPVLLIFVNYCYFQVSVMLQIVVVSQTDGIIERL